MVHIAAGERRSAFNEVNSDGVAVELLVPLLFCKEMLVLHFRSMIPSCMVDNHPTLNRSEKGPTVQK